MDKLPLFDPIKRHLGNKKVVQTFTCLQLLLVTTVTNAIVSNPGATCPAGYLKGTPTNADYTTLMNSYNNGSYVTLAGNNGIPLQVKMTKTESNPNTILTNFSAYNASTSSGTFGAINIAHDMPYWSDNVQIKLDFQNNATSQPIYLTNVALSAFDIDSAYDSNNNFDDSVIITGINASGKSIRGTIQSIGSNIVDDGTYGLNNNGNVACDAKTLDGQCQGSVQFSEPVRSVTITYSNTNYYYYNYSATNSTNQEIDFRLDNYCYQIPPAAYSITKDDGNTSIATGSNTTYTIKVTNSGGTTLSNIVLKDPAVTGLTKLSNITCDNNDATNTCSSSPLPTIAQLEGSGYTISSLAVGKTYTIKVPVNVTAAAGSSITNSATIGGGGLTAQTASDTNNVTSAFTSGGTPTPASCPAGDRMYYIGNNPPASSYAKQSLSNWIAGSTSNTYSFTDGTIATIKFENIKDATSYNGVASPQYTSMSALGVGSIAMYNSSTGAVTNHSISLSVNKPVSRAGYIINDLDSYNTGSGTAYQERFDVSGSNGILTLTNSSAQTINASNNIITSIKDINCSDSYGSDACPDNATWSYSPANTEFKGYHSNATTTASSQAHAVGYNDFFFCLAPPKLITQKVLNGSRAQSNDQFTLTTTGTSVNNTFTTQGTGSTIDTGTNKSTLITLGTSATYSIAETIANSGSLKNYNTTYNCKNSTSSTSTMPSGNGSSFNISNLAYGDEITCTVTNTPLQYIFSGTVFDDASVTATANNGILDSGETGITGTSVKLTDCGSTVLGTTTTDGSGNYNFTFPASNTTISSLSKVCIVETNLSTYPNDTSSNNITVSLSGAKAYTNNNFGDIKNPLLKLIKYQQVVPCNTTDLVTLDTGFTTNNLGTAGDVPSGSCIAYKIEAINLGNVPLSNVVITDPLMNDTQRVSKVYATPAPKLCISGKASANCDASKVTSTTDANGTNTVKTTEFTIPGSGTADAKKATLYFNTLYSLK